MKFMKKPVKNVKKVIYKGRIHKFRRFIAFMIIGGIIASVLSFFGTVYKDYASAHAHVVLTYPEIAESQYSDGSRFTYYDFVSLDRLDEALKIMQENNKYTTYTVDDIKDSFFVRSYLDNSASNDVTLARLSGDDFSYVANEYIITFVQPHDYGNPNLFTKIVSPNHSAEFMQVLADINKRHFAETKSGKKGFEIITELKDMSGYDYDERATIYRSKIGSIVNYLKTIEKNSSDFISREHIMSLRDISGKYDLLISNKLDGISDFIETSEISKNTDVAINKLSVNLENDTLTYNKYLSEASITKYAMQNYDQTFTENLINVVRDESQGLYQARPKTAFDKIVTRNNDAEEKVSSYKEKINNTQLELSRFSATKSPAPEKEAAPAEEATAPEGEAAEATAETAEATEAPAAETVAVDPEETKRLAEKCDKLFEDFDKEYNELTATAASVVNECLDTTNEGFMTVEIEKDSVFNLSLITNMFFAFLAGAVIMFVICVFFSVLADNAELKRKRKKLRKISEEKGV